MAATSNNVLHYIPWPFQQGNHDKESSRGDDIVAQDAGLGFDDPFFKQDVAVATAGKKNERRKMAKEGEKREEEKVRCMFF